MYQVALLNWPANVGLMLKVEDAEDEAMVRADPICNCDSGAVIPMPTLPDVGLTMSEEFSLTPPVLLAKSKYPEPPELVMVSPFPPMVIAPPTNNVPLPPEPTDKRYPGLAVPTPTFPPCVTTNGVEEPTVKRFETVDVPMPTPVPAAVARRVEETT